MEHSNAGEGFDVIVVGGGIMGSCAAYEVAKRGQRALLLERFDFLHHLGSSHGESRTIRAIYPETYYPPMVLESARLWEEAQSEIGYRVLTKTLQFDMGPADNRALQSVISSCKSNSIDLQILDQTQIAHMFNNSFQLPEGWIGVVTDIGGVIKPTKALAMFQSLAIRRGAVLRDHMEVKGIERDAKKGGGIWVSTTGGDRFWGRKCVVAAGAWTTKLVEAVSGLVLPIHPIHTTICYWKIKEGYSVALSPDGGFPSFANYGEPYIYGTPSMEFPGLIKIALHGGHPCDPDRRDWKSSLSGTTMDSVSPWIEQVLPRCVEAGKPVMTQACMYSMTPDGDFVIDFLGGEFGKDVVVAGGFSGHGFKMAPLVGRILAELAIDEEATRVEMRHFRIGRFEDDPKGNAKEFEDQSIWTPSVVSAPKFPRWTPSTALRLRSLLVNDFWPPSACVLFRLHLLLSKQDPIPSSAGSQFPFSWLSSHPFCCIGSPMVRSSHTLCTLGGNHLAQTRLHCNQMRE